MTIDRRHFLAGTAALVALPARAREAEQPASGLPLLDTLAEEMLRHNPEEATSLGLDGGARADLKSRIGDNSAAGRARTAAWLRSAVERLDAVDRAGLDADTRTHVDVARTAFATALEGYGFPFGAVAVGSWRNGPYVVAQNMGLYLDAPKFLDANHKIASTADAEAYLARLDALPAQVDAETERLREARGRGVVASDVLMDKTLSALRLSHAGAPATWLEVTSLQRRTLSIPGDWAARATRIAAERLGPAFARQQAELEQHRRVATAAPGVAKFRDGDAYYAWALRASTTTRMTPDEVHGMGQEELRQLQSEMDGILRGIGYSKGTVGARMRALEQDPRYRFPDDDAGRAEILRTIEATWADIRPRLPRAFGRPVAGRVEVKRIAPAEEIGAPGAYGGAGTIDGSVPGRFWINLRTTALHTRYSLPTLTFHESIPGHVWQGEYAHRLPLIRTLMSFNAFSEGWALYAEQLASELGVYEGNPVGRLGYLQSIAFRACRLVVDTGLHARGWSRAQAIDWFASTNGSPVEEVTGEVDRYCAWPGQACGYKVGHSTINRLRRATQAALGRGYDARAFNDAVVGGGGVPMTVLAANLQRRFGTKAG